MCIVEEELKQKLIKYYKSLGVEVCTHTNAHGYQGYFSDNKIEISKAIRKERIIPTLLHEFSHFIHQKLDPDMVMTGGSIETLFDLTKTRQAEFLQSENLNLSTYQLIDLSTEKNFSLPHLLTSSPIKEELLQVTNFVDKSSECNILECHKKGLDDEIKALGYQIKRDYPHFKKSKKFNEFENFVNEAKSNNILSEEDIEEGSNMPEPFSAYVKLKAAIRERARIHWHINKYKKYYATPTELFARFVEGLYIDSKKICKIANKAYNRFFELLENNYYFELKNVFQLLRNEAQTI